MHIFHHLHLHHHHQAGEIGRGIHAVAASEIGRDIHVAASEVKLDANLGENAAAQFSFSFICLFRGLLNQDINSLYLSFIPLTIYIY